MQITWPLASGCWKTADTVCEKENEIGRSSVWIRSKTVSRVRTKWNINEQFSEKQLVHSCKHNATLASNIVIINLIGACNQLHHFAAIYCIQRYHFSWLLLLVAWKFCADRSGEQTFHHKTVKMLAQTLRSTYMSGCKTFFIVAINFSMTRFVRAKYTK